MSNPKDAFATIDPAALESVVGGRRAASSSGATQERIMDQLNSLENAIRDLGRNQNTGPDPMSQLLPLLMLSMMNRPQPAAAAPAPAVVCQGGGGGKKGW